MVWILQWCKGVTAENEWSSFYTWVLPVNSLPTYVERVSGDQLWTLQWVYTATTAPCRRPQLWWRRRCSAPGATCQVQPQLPWVLWTLLHAQGSGQHCLPQPAQPMQHHWYPSPTTLADTFAGAGVLTKATHALPKDAKVHVLNPNK